MKITDYLKLNVPELTDSPPDITKISDNFPKIDANAKLIWEQINNFILESPWQTICLDFTGGDWIGEIYYRKNQIGQIELRFHSISASMPTASTPGTIIAILPINYHPAEVCAIPLHQKSDGKAGSFLYINTSGIISIPIFNSGIENAKYYDGQCILFT